MYNDYISEAFKSLELLTEDIFDTSPKGVSNLGKFLDDDDDAEIVRVIDNDASSEDELQDSYIGKVVINCNICHSHVYENKEDIVIEDDGAVNIEMQCPYCGEQEGFTIVGEISEFKPETPSEDSDEDSNDESASDLELESPEDEPEIVTESIEDRYGAPDTDVHKVLVKVCNELQSKLGSKAKVGLSKTGRIVVLKSDVEDLSDVVNNLDVVKSNNWKAVTVEHEGNIYCCALKGAESKEALKESRNFKPHTRRLLKLIGSDLLKDDNNINEAVGAAAAAPILATAGKIALGTAAATLGAGVANKVLGDDVESEESEEDLNESIGAAIAAAAPVLATAGKIALGTGAATLGAGLANKVLGDDLDDSSYDKFQDLLNEDFKEVSITTDDQHMEMTSDDNGKVTVTTEPVNNSITDEVISPISDETQSEIIANNDTPLPDELDTSVEDDSIEDVDFEEVDEESLNDLGESYLKRVYENVDSFNVSNIYSDESRMIVEGVIGFNSGAKKTTKFVFESSDMNDKGQLRFHGRNKHLTEDTRAYSLVGHVDNKKLFVESLKYNYSVSDNSVRGVVRRK